MKRETGFLGLMILLLSVVGLFWYNSKAISEKHKVEKAIIQKLEEDNGNAQKAFGSLIKQKIQMKKLQLWDCQTESDHMTCHAYVDLVTFRGQENQEMKVRLEKEGSNWRAVQLSKI